MTYRDCDLTEEHGPHDYWTNQPADAEMLFQCRGTEAIESTLDPLLAFAWFMDGYFDIRHEWMPLTAEDVNACIREYREAEARGDLDV